MRKSLTWFAFVFTSLVEAAWPATVTVSKPGGGGTYTTVQAGINAAGANGRVTVLDSQTYTEDVTIGTTQSGITLQAAAGKNPLIQAANAVNRVTAYGFDSPADHFGLMVQAPCTLTGLKIKQPSAQGGHRAGWDDTSAFAIFIYSQGVTLRGCEIIGPGVSPATSWTAGCLIVALSTTPSSVALEGCVIHHFRGGVDNGTARDLNPNYSSSNLRLSNCEIHDCYEGGCSSDAGNFAILNCRIHDNPGRGVHVSGGSAVLNGCDITGNGEGGLSVSWSSDNTGLSNFPRVTATNCLFMLNGDQATIEVEDGSLTLDHSIVAQSSNDAISMNRGTNSDTVLNADFCDIYAPGGNCVWLDSASGKPAFVSIKNSILSGVNGVMLQAPQHGNVCYSDVSVSGTAFQNVLTSNTVAIAPQYVSRNAGTRSGFRYYNRNLNVGQGGRWIGSQGPAPTACRNWSLYY